MNYLLIKKKTKARENSKITEIMVNIALKLHIYFVLPDRVCSQI